MATLAKDKIRKVELESPKVPNDLPMIATDTIFQGAAVGDNASGFMRPLVAGDPFRGFCEAQATGGVADGDVEVRVAQKGTIELVVATVVDEDDVGETVYAIDDDSFTLVAGANTPIGKVARHVSGTTAFVYFESEVVQSL